jgi:CRP-like cAMP-binding protein
VNSSETLARAELFAELPAEDLDRIARLAVRRTAAEGEAIVKQGELGVAFYVIESGQAAIATKQGDSEEQLAVIGPGAFFGEMALFENQVRSATVTALKPTKLVVLTRWDFLAELKRPGSSIAVAMLAVLARRIRALDANSHQL